MVQRWAITLVTAISIRVVANSDASYPACSSRLLMSTLAHSTKNVQLHFGTDDDESREKQHLHEVRLRQRLLASTTPCAT